MLDFVDELNEGCAVGTVARERIRLLQLISDFGQQAFHCGVDTAQGARLQLEIDLRDKHIAALALEHVTVDVFRVLHVECDLGGLLTNATSLFDLCALVATRITAESHNDDLLEVGDGRTAHFDEARGEAGRARLGEPHDFLLDVTLFGLVRLVVDRLAEINPVRSDLSILIERRRHSFTIGESLLFLLFVDGDHFGEESLLLLRSRLHCLSSAARRFTGGMLLR